MLTKDIVGEVGDVYVSYQLLSLGNLTLLLGTKNYSALALVEPLKIMF